MLSYLNLNRSHVYTIWTFPDQRTSTRPTCTRVRISDDDVDADRYHKPRAAYPYPTQKYLG